MDFDTWDLQVRAFRHTCTLIGMTLVTSLIDIAKMVQMDLENTERQLETELKKGQAKRAFAKVIIHCHVDMFLQV